MKGKVILAFVVLTLSCAVKGSSWECRCESPQPIFSRKVYLSPGLGISIPYLGISPSVTFAFSETIAAQECKCRYCCPEEECIQPTAMIKDVPVELEIPDPLDPRYVRTETRKIHLIPTPDREEWVIKEMVKGESGILEACVAEKKLIFTKAGTTIAIGIPVGPPGSPISVRVNLPGPLEQPLTLFPSPCRCGDPQNYTPQIVDAPKSFCLAPGNPVRIAVVAYDPNGVEDLHTFQAVTRGGVVAREEGVFVRTWELGGSAKQVLVKEAVFTIDVEETAQAENVGLGFIVLDKIGSHDSRSVRVELLKPLEIRAAGEPRQRRCGFLWLRRCVVVAFEIVDPLGSNEEVILKAEAKGTGQSVNLDYPKKIRLEQVRAEVTVEVSGFSGEWKGEVSISASILRCGTIISTFNGVPVHACFDFPEVLVAPDKMVAKPGDRIEAVVEGRLPCSIDLVLQKISGPGDFPTIRGRARVTGTYTWTVPEYYARGPRWEMVTFRADDGWGGVDYATLVVWIERPMYVYASPVTVRRGSMTYTAISVDDGDASPIPMDFPPFFLSFPLLPAFWLRRSVTSAVRAMAGLWP